MYTFIGTLMSKKTYKLPSLNVKRHTFKASGMNCKVISRPVRCINRLNREIQRAKKHQSTREWRSVDWTEKSSEPKNISRPESEDQSTNIEKSREHKIISRLESEDQSTNIEKSREPSIISRPSQKFSRLRTIHQSTTNLISRPRATWSVDWTLSSVN